MPLVINDFFGDKILSFCKKKSWQKCQFLKNLKTDQNPHNCLQYAKGA